MTRPAARPGKGRRARTTQFSYYGTKPSEKWFGWLAGPPVWVEAHTQPVPSKPCLTWWTRGQIPCQRCRPNVEPELIAYVGIYREKDLKDTLVIIHESAADLLDGLAYPDYVCVSRECGETDGVVIQRALSKKKFITSLDRRKQPVDIEPSLLTMWRLNELTEWVRCQSPQTALPGGVVPPVPGAKPNNVTLDLPRIRAAMEHQADNSAANASRARQIADAIGRMQPSQNGSHTSTDAE